MSFIPEVSYLTGVQAGLEGEGVLSAMEVMEYRRALLALLNDVEKSKRILAGQEMTASASVARGRATADTERLKAMASILRANIEAGAKVNVAKINSIYGPAAVAQFKDQNAFAGEIAASEIAFGLRSTEVMPGKLEGIVKALKAGNVNEKAIAGQLDKAFQAIANDKSSGFAQIKLASEKRSGGDRIESERLAKVSLANSFGKSVEIAFANELDKETAAKLGLMAQSRALEVMGDQAAAASFNTISESDYQSARITDQQRDDYVKESLVKGGGMSPEAAASILAAFGSTPASQAELDSAVAQGVGRRPEERDPQTDFLVDQIKAQYEEAGDLTKSEYDRASARVRATPYYEELKRGLGIKSDRRMATYIIMNRGAFRSGYSSMEKYAQQAISDPSNPYHEVFKNMGYGAYERNHDLVRKALDSDLGDPRFVQRALARKARQEYNLQPGIMTGAELKRPTAAPAPTAATAPTAAPAPTAAKEVPFDREAFEKNKRELLGEMYREKGLAYQYRRNPDGSLDVVHDDGRVIRVTKSKHITAIEGVIKSGKAVPSIQPAIAVPSPPTIAEGERKTAEKYEKLGAELVSDDDRLMVVPRGQPPIAEHAYEMAKLKAEERAGRAAWIETRKKMDARLAKRQEEDLSALLDKWVLEEESRGSQHEGHQAGEGGYPKALGKAEAIHPTEQEFRNELEQLLNAKDKQKVRKAEETPKIPAPKPKEFLRSAKLEKMVKSRGYPTVKSMKKPKKKVIQRPTTEDTPKPAKAAPSTRKTRGEMDKEAMGSFLKNLSKSGLFGPGGLAAEEALKWYAGQEEEE